MRLRFTLSGNNKEVRRYQTSSKLPDMLKKVERADLHFNMHVDEKIVFEIYYEPAVKATTRLLGRKSYR